MIACALSCGLISLNFCPLPRDRALCSVDDCAADMSAVGACGVCTVLHKSCISIGTDAVVVDAISHTCSFSRVQLIAAGSVR